MTRIGEWYLGGEFHYKTVSSSRHAAPRVAISIPVLIREKVPWAGVEWNNRVG